MATESLDKIRLNQMDIGKEKEHWQSIVASLKQEMERVSQYDQEVLLEHQAMQAKVKEYEQQASSLYNQKRAVEDRFQAQERRLEEMSLQYTEKIGRAHV